MKPYQLAKCMPFRAALLICLVVLGGCATAAHKGDDGTANRDPLEKINRVTYKFNDVIDRALLKPVAKGYKKMVPSPARAGVSNFFSNLGSPIVIANDLLQGKLLIALSDSGRFVMNSTLGIFGLFDVAQHAGMPEHSEDLGQTLAVWGVPSGPYIVLPFLGPSTLRDGLGSYADSSISLLRNQANVPERNKAYLVNGINSRASLLDVDKLIQQAFDPYQFIRDAYFQHRRYEIYDGNPPPEYPDFPEDEEDKSGSDSGTGDSGG